MNKKIFLTSAAIMCMACPAIAETFPQDGNMLENKTYDNAATYTNTGIYEGDVTADAEYSLNPYTVAAGSYFTGLDNNNAATTAQCTSGNYCPGVQSTTYDDVNSAFVNTGLQACPQNYSGSAAGATANTDCYRTCSTTDVAKSATVSGQMYYNGTDGDGVNACSAETCVSGWHKKSGMSGSALQTAVGTGAGENSASVDNTGSFSQQTFGGTNRAQSFYGITENNTWAVYYDSTHGMVTGASRCSNVYGTSAWSGASSASDITTHTTAELGAEGGNYCWCNVTGYTPAGGTLQSLSSRWVYGNSSNVMGSCASRCASFCARYMRDDGEKFLMIRAAVLGSVSPSPASCEANTINITWNDASAEDIAATGAATTVYEGDIKTPLKAITKPGKTFVGWKFIKPTNPAPVQGEGD